MACSWLTLGRIVPNFVILVTILCVSESEHLWAPRSP